LFLSKKKNGFYLKRENWKWQYIELFLCTRLPLHATEMSGHRSSLCTNRGELVRALFVARPGWNLFSEFLGDELLALNFSM
jgi:hypothetical protein